MSRREFLKLGAKLGAFLMFPPPPLLPAGATPASSPEAAIEIEVNPWLQRKQEIAKKVLTNNLPLVSLDVPGKVVPFLPEEVGSPFYNLLEFGNFQAPVFRPAREVISETAVVPAGWKLGVPGMLELLENRYAEIRGNGYGNPELLAKSLDPTVDDFATLTAKYAELTGAPQEVVAALWWRENLGRGNFSAEAHNGGLPSGDGALAPNLQLYVLPVEVPRVNPGFNNRFYFAAFPRENKLSDRTSEEIIVTDIPIDLIKADTEMNILFGLILYQQSQELVRSDPKIKAFIDGFKVENRRESATGYHVRDFDDWDWSYMVYHLGGMALHNKIQHGDMVIEQDFLRDPVVNAAYFRRSRQKKPWNWEENKTPSLFPEDPDKPLFYEANGQALRNKKEFLRRDPEFFRQWTDFETILNSLSTRNNKGMGFEDIRLYGLALIGKYPAVKSQFLDNVAREVSPESRQQLTQLFDWLAEIEAKYPLGKVFPEIVTNTPVAHGLATLPEVSPFISFFQRHYEQLYRSGGANLISNLVGIYGYGLSGYLFPWETSRVPVANQVFAERCAEIPAFLKNFADLPAPAYFREHLTALPQSSRRKAAELAGNEEPANLFYTELNTASLLAVLTDAPLRQYYADCLQFFDKDLAKKYLAVAEKFAGLPAVTVPAKRSGETDDVYRERLAKESFLIKQLGSTEVPREALQAMAGLYGIFEGNFLPAFGVYLSPENPTSFAEDYIPQLNFFLDTFSDSVESVTALLGRQRGI